MKKLIYGTLILAIVGIGIVGCKKDSISPEEKIEIQDGYNEPQFKSSSSANRVLDYIFHNGQALGVWCHRTNGNCLPTIVVTPSIYNHVEDVETVILTGVLSDIVTKFDDDETIIDGYIDASVVDNVINGTYTVITERGYYDNNEIYFIFSDQQNNIQVVYPFKQ